LLFLVAITFTIIRLRDLFAAVMLSGIFSLLAAGLFTVMDAVDVAFTEAAVGAGISTVLMVATLSLTRRREAIPRKKVGLAPLLLVIGTGAVLVYGSLDLPHYGDPNAPAQTHPMTTRFLEDSVHEVGPPNIVTSVLASYRGYDTFGETTVVFTASVGVLLLLGARGRRRGVGTDTTGTDTTGTDTAESGEEAQ
jgi:multicomponent Na+:H+ antiporter subunit B